MTLAWGQNGKKGARPLIGILVAAFILLGTLHSLLYFSWGPSKFFPELPWVVPVTNALVMLSAWSVALLSFGRCAVRRDAVSFWTGLGFAALGTCQIFYVLAWPGLLPDGRAIIGVLPSTAAWISMLTLGLPGILLLAAVWVPWPQGSALNRKRWVWLAFGCLLGLAFLNIAVVVFEASLPVLVLPDGRFTPLLRVFQWSITIVFGLGVVASSRYYIRTGDTLPGYAALSQLFIFFFELAIVLGDTSYGQLTFADRFLVIAGFVAVLFGLLLEYVRIYRQELWRARELEKNAEKLRKSEVRYRQLFDDDLTGNFLSTPDGEILLCNPPFASMFGFSTVQDALGKNVRELYPDSKEREDLVRQVRQHGKVERFEAWRKRRDGAPIHVVQNLVGHFNEVGELYEIKGYIFDDTERQRAEDGLRKSEQRYRTLFESIDEGFCTIELLFDENQKPIDYRFLEVNPAFERHTGLKDPIGRRMKELAPQHEEYWFSFYGHVALTGVPSRFENQAAGLGRHYDVYAFRIGDPSQRRVAVLFTDDTKRKGAEEALRKERDFSAAVLDTAGALVVVLDRAAKIRRFNRACVELTGYTEADVLGHEVWFLIPPEDLPGVQQEWATLTAGKAPTRRENHWVARDGTRRLIAWSNGLLTSPTGDIEFVIGTGLDISDRKRVEQALKESEARMTRAQAIAHLGSWELDLLKDELTWSDEVYRIFGLEPQSLQPTYEAFLQAVHPGDRAAVASTFSSSLRDGTDRYEIEHRIIHAATGEVRIVHEKCEHLRDASGRIVRSQGMVHDITDRKRAEEALERSEARLAQGMRVAGLGIFEHDHRTDVIEFSSVMRQLLGFAADDKVTISSILQKVLPEDREFFADSIRRAHDPGGDGRFEVDYRVPDKLGGIRWVSARSQTFFTGEGTERGAVRTIGAALDVTDRKEAQSRLERVVAERTAQLAEANEGLQHFAHSAAHDLSSPLRGINGFAAAMLQEYGPQLDADGRSMLQRIVSSATQMAQLLTALLEYSKLSQAELQLEKVSLDDVVREALSLQEAEIRVKQAEVRAAPPLPSAVGHHATMVMVVANLISNGLKFMPPGVKPQLQIWAEPSPCPGREGPGPRSCVRLWVQDNGIGIAPHDHPKVFEVFRRLHGKKTYPGTGLGLAIVQKAIERMGGNVGLESEVGKGSRFWIEFKQAE